MTILKKFIFGILLIISILLVTNFFLNVKELKTFKKYEELVKTNPNDAEACFELGICYEEGIGTDIDKNKAYELLVLAKDLSSGLAENFIKEFYK